MRKFLLVPCILLMLGVRMPMAAESSMDDGSVNGATGFGIGALVGALVGGPVGALVGAAGGAYFAEQDAAKDETIDTLEAKLVLRDSELAELKSGFEQTQVAMTGDVTLLERRPAAPFSLPVYFRTDEAGIEQSLLPHLARLAGFLKANPALTVQLDGYSDRRGGTDYNRALSARRTATIRRILEEQGVAQDRIREFAYGESRALAAPGESEAMVFDRAVIITIGDVDSSQA